MGKYSVLGLIDVNYLRDLADVLVYLNRNYAVEAMEGASEKNTGERGVI